jgi:hypothetical protein
MEHVLGAMITLAGNKAGSIDVSSLTKKLINDLDKNNDGKVSKGKIDLLNLLIFLINPLKF